MLKPEGVFSRALRLTSNRLKYTLLLIGVECKIIYVLPIF
nr:MAG TPA: hypothetical protein [Caudoviricetes sp.]